MSNSLDPDQGLCFVGFDFDPGLQKMALIDKKLIELIFFFYIP